MNYKSITEYLTTIGAKGGKNRAKTLNAKRRKAIAKKAARARWGKKSKKARTA